MRFLGTSFMDTGATFSWLHISDLHAGMKDASHLWPQIKTQILKDLRRHLAEQGPIDLVVFSGDLTQTAKEEEFAAVLSDLKDFWVVFSEYEVCPKLVVVPGNHDLTRPAADSPLLMAVESFRKRPSVRESLVKDDESEYRKELYSAFSNYENFITRLENSEIPLATTSRGIFPGDCAGVMEVNGLRVGIVGLNSAWSHLEKGDFRGKLEFYDLQVDAVVGGDIEKWSYANHINLLVTHHPKDWLNPDALKDFQNEVSPLGRFDAHLFGHMHELSTRSYGFGGQQVKREYQAASLFGSERDSNGAITRRHGFSIARIDAERECFSVWPRKADRISAGGWRVNIDMIELPDGGSVAESPIKLREVAFSSKKKNSHGLSDRQYALSPATPSSEFSTSRWRSKRHKLPIPKPHMELAFPRTNFDNFGRIAKSDKLTWLVSPWDIDGEAFLSCAQKLNLISEQCYKIDCHKLSDFSSFIEALQAELELSEPELHYIISREKETTIIFDHIQSGKYSSGLSIFSEIRNFSETLIKRCLNVSVVVKTTHDIANAGLDPVILKPMDEVDCGRYVLSHPLSYRVNEIDLASGEIYLITKGSSQAVDKLLDKLEYMKLTDMTIETSEAALNDVSIEDIPEVLIYQMKQFEARHDDYSIDLLKCLTIFPFGEDISNLKYFYKDKAIYPRVGGPLVKAGLSEGLRFFIFRNEPAVLPKVIVAKSLVQDYLRLHMTKEEYEELTIQALNLYFGCDWSLGKPKLNSNFNLDNSNHSTHAIRNANCLLRRIYNDAIEADIPRKIQDSLTLLSYYVRRLISAHLYRHVISLCHVLYKKLCYQRDNHFVKDILYAYGKSLRMVREFQRSIEVMTDLLIAKVLTVEFEAKIYSDIALNYEEQQDGLKAVSAAKKALTYRGEGSTYFHAQTIIICNSDKSNKEKKLKDLKIKSKNKRCFIASNNISIRIQSMFGVDKDARETFASIAETAKKNGDIYNFIRATIRYSAATAVENIPLSEKEMSNLFFAYHVVFSQRLIGLFNAGHAALWAEYERQGEIPMLVSLFKQGSFIYRGNVDEKRERSYLTRLLSGKLIPTHLLLSNITKEDRDFLIERVRALRIGQITESGGAFSLIREEADSQRLALT
ncbi:Metallophosphoesterase [Pseudomonas amygdali pv. hibisci]|nr:Metallophosphoesterase [Pseudomonas amygdali pv. hibisci]